MVLNFFRLQTASHLSKLVMHPVTCRSCWLQDLVVVLLCEGQMPRARGMASYVRDGCGAFRQPPKFEFGCCAVLVFMVCGVRQNLNIFSLYRYPDLDERIFDGLLTSMAACRAG